jgi:hypothetical protein
LEVLNTAFCSKCGAELPEGAQFCPKCGQPAGGPAAQPGPFDGMGRREMRHEYRRMRREERWGRWASPEWALFNSIFAGLFIILLGGLLYLAASGLLPDLVTWSNFWAYLLLGLGVLLLIRGFFEIITQHYHGYGQIIGGLVLVVIGASGITAFLPGWAQYFWIVIIILGGLLVILVGLLTYLFRR